jgi:hypothetical protein
MEILAAEVALEGPVPGEASSTLALDAARERFVSQFAQLQPGESAAPLVQQFIPAILPALRVALTIIGRQRVVNFLAGHLGRLIRSLVGPQQAMALSRALVDTGLRLISLETEAEAPQNEAARAVAATLEDTVRQLAEFGFEQFEQLDESPEQQRVLETLATEAFFQSAIAHLPSQLLDPQRLDEREMLPEMAGEAGVWVYRPKPRYKKYTRIFEITLSPQTAARIRSFGTSTLATFLRARGVRPPSLRGDTRDRAEPDCPARAARARSGLWQRGRLVTDPSLDHGGGRSAAQSAWSRQGCRPPVFWRRATKLVSAMTPRPAWSRENKASVVRSQSAVSGSGVSKRSPASYSRRTRSKISNARDPQRRVRPPRVRSLAAFGRRPQPPPAISRPAGIRNPSQGRTITRVHRNGGKRAVSGDFGA